VYLFSGIHWTSANDIGREPGQFYWAEGRKTEKWVWSQNEPDSHNPGQDTCALLTSNFVIGDLPCSRKYPYICEKRFECKN
jgi:hypothetical protein